MALTLRKTYPHCSSSPRHPRSLCCRACAVWACVPCPPASPAALSRASIPALGLQVLQVPHWPLLWGCSADQALSSFCLRLWPLAPTVRLSLWVSLVTLPTGPLLPQPPTTMVPLTGPLLLPFHHLHLLPPDPPVLCNHSPPCPVLSAPTLSLRCLAFLINCLAFRD